MSLWALPLRNQTDSLARPMAQGVEHEATQRISLVDEVEVDLYDVAVNVWAPPVPGFRTR